MALLVKLGEPAAPPPPPAAPGTIFHRRLVFGSGYQPPIPHRRLTQLPAFGRRCASCSPELRVERSSRGGGRGACEGTLACSTCHLIFEDHIYEKLDSITDEENDMLDLAYGLTDRSRLGCQIYLTKSMDNMTVRVPEAVADARQSVDMGKSS
ncbi:Adrenodoxin, mitochondrial [Heterocephalus glaber]|uniref:Adrenodoxin, mitochondrial n=1 Tax=Heterocephalus glaber TaxID=10181 RepID=G5C2E1_HETGA|nr:Adrenodoxin, mitochondrial [Heterocephalus glaber]